jgi:hypothetical protein
VEDFWTGTMRIFAPVLTLLTLMLEDIPGRHRDYSATDALGA